MRGDLVLVWIATVKKTRSYIEPESWVDSWSSKNSGLGAKTLLSCYRCSLLFVFFLTVYLSREEVILQFHLVYLSVLNKYFDALLPSMSDAYALFLLLLFFYCVVF